MKRRVLVLLLALSWLPALDAQPPTSEQKQTTLAYLYSLQRENGAFVADRSAAKPTLPATSSALRAIKYFGGEVQKKEECLAFIRSCRPEKSGGYAPTPGGAADIRTTAVGMMAVRELGARAESGQRLDFPGICYLAGGVKTFEDWRIAAAAFETEGYKNTYATSDRWLEVIRDLHNPDGTFGKGENLARDTGGTVVAILRMGGRVEGNQRAAVVQAIKAGQRADGGWGKEGDKSSDLETSYRVMRAFHMLKEKPDVAACTGFIAKCRNADGSYSVQPGQPGNVSATYFAGIILHWLAEMK